MRMMVLDGQAVRSGDLLGHTRRQIIGVEIMRDDFRVYIEQALPMGDPLLECPESRDVLEIPDVMG